MLCCLSGNVYVLPCFMVRPRLAIQSLHPKGVEMYLNQNTNQFVLWFFKESVAAWMLRCFNIYCVHISVLLIIQLISPVKDGCEKTVNHKWEHSRERSSIMKGRSHSSSLSLLLLPAGSPRKHTCYVRRERMWVYADISADFRPSLTHTPHLFFVTHLMTSACFQ